MSFNPISAVVPATAPSAKGTAAGAPASASPFAALLSLLGGGSDEVKDNQLTMVLADYAAMTGQKDKDPTELLDDLLASNGISLSKDELTALLESAGPPAQGAPNVTGTGQLTATTAPVPAHAVPGGDIAIPEALRAALNTISAAAGSPISATTSSATSAADPSATTSLTIAEDGARQVPLSGRSAMSSIEQLFGRAAQQAEGAVSGQGGAVAPQSPETQSFADRLLQHAMARRAQAPDTSVQALMQAAAQSAASQSVEPVPVQTSIDLNAIAASGMDRPVIVVRGEGSSQGQGALPLTQIAVTIQREASKGHRRFEIRLDPPDLGRIDVRLEMTRDGRMLTNLTVDRPETLDHLMRDARQLERALMNTGLKLDDNGLQFSLRDQGQGGGRFSGFDGDPSQTAAGQETSDETDAVAEPAMGRRAGSQAGTSSLDLTI